MMPSFSDEELAAAAGPNALMATLPQNTALPAGQMSAAEEMRLRERNAKAREDAWAAAFRQDNTIGAIFSRRDTGVDNHPDPDFSWQDYMREHPEMAGFEDTIARSLNRRHADAVRDQVTMEQQDRQTLQAAGAVGVIAGIAAGAIDWPTLIPGGVVFRGANGMYTVAKSALMAGASAGAAVAAQESLLQANQRTRPLAESAINVGAGVVIGSLLGAGAAAILGKNERIAMERALDEHMTRVESGDNPLDPKVIADAGAAVAPGDPNMVARSREELAVAGTAAGALAKATNWINPMLRSTQRYAASARQLGNAIYENTIYRAMHAAGMTTGVSVETAVRTMVSSLEHQATSAALSEWKALRKAGLKMSEDEFFESIGPAMRNGDQGANEFVNRAAAAYRKGFTDLAEQARKLGLLPDEFRDLTGGTAESYFTRVYNRERLGVDEGKFLDVISREVAPRMQAEHEKDLADLMDLRKRMSTIKEDLSLAGEARSSRIEEIRRAGVALDAQYADLEDTVTRLSEIRGEMRDRSITPERRAELREEEKALRLSAGEPLTTYERERARLRERMRALREQNPDAQAARREQAEERISKVFDQAVKSSQAYARRAKNLINKIDSDPVSAAEELRNITARQLRDLERANAATEQRLNKYKAQYVDSVNPAAEFDAAAARASAAGATGEQAVRAGTRAYDAAVRRIEVSRNSIAEFDARLERIAALTERLGDREANIAAKEELVKETQALLDQISELNAARQMERGAYAAQQMELAAKLSPEQIQERLAERLKAISDRVNRADEKYAERWGRRLAENDEQPGARFDFEGAARRTAQDVFDAIMHRPGARQDGPSFITKVTAGPMKDRVFNVPDALLQSHGWLENDARFVFSRYARQMAGEIAIKRKFDPNGVLTVNQIIERELGKVQEEYSRMQVAVHEAENGAQIDDILGTDKFKRAKDLEKAKIEAARLLRQDEAGALEDTKAGFEMIRGTYRIEENSSNFARVARSAMHFNYLRSMGGVLLSNLADFYRPAMVHGLMPYLSTMPQALAQAFGSGSRGFQLALKEGKLAGVVTERVNHAIAGAIGDVGDPLVGKAVGLERLLAKGTQKASKLNFINLFTDAQQAIASSVSQHRILEAVIGEGGEKGQRLLRMLGIDEKVQRDIAMFFRELGQEVDGVRVANTEEWLRWASKQPGTEMMKRAEEAVRTYRAAVNLDVNSIVSRRGLGDAPLLANTPIGKVLLQFSGFMLGAHSRVTIRALQEDKSRLLGGVVALTGLGMLSAYLAAWRGGRERFDKFREEVERNPAILVAEGLDRSGIFPLAFDLSNRIERISGSVGYDYRLNPIKSGIAAASIAAGTGQGSPLGIASTRGSDSAAAFGAILGPSASMIDGGLAFGRSIGDYAQGRTPPKRDVNQALAMLPGQSYFGFRELLQVLTNNSPYWRQ